MRFAALLFLLATTCQPQRTRCEKACRIEAECADELEAAEVDVSECIETCRDLERRSDTRAVVDVHVACVEAANGCASILECP